MNDEGGRMKPAPKGPAARPRRLVPLACVVVFLTGCLAGCARYEYDVVEPPDLAGHVGTKSWTALRRGELEYRLRTSDNRLVMLIYNRGEAPVKLLGDDSAAVDPRGESHPLQSATIPPGSYAKRIFPPPRPRVERFGPSIGIGVGGGIGRGYGRHRHFYHDPFDPGFAAPVEPRYYTVYDPNDRTYFDWPGEGGVRFLFAYERGDGESLRHAFLIRRRKM
jgi:hypothetical protein